jgi:protein SCO1/2
VLASSQRLLLLVLLLLLVAIGVVLLTGQRTQSHATATSTFSGPTMPPGLRAADFSLSDQNGNRVTLSQYRGKVVVMTFIHSLCHDECPFMVEQIKGALNLLGGSKVPALGISVAPGQDTVTNRRKFLVQHEMTTRLSFLNGSTPQMRQLWHAYAIAPGSQPFGHSAVVLLIDKRGIERVGFAADQLTPEGLAHDIRVLEGERG